MWLQLFSYLAAATWLPLYFRVFYTFMRFGQLCGCFLSCKVLYVETYQVSTAWYKLTQASYYFSIVALSNYSTHLTTQSVILTHPFDYVIVSLSCSVVVRQSNCRTKKVSIVACFVVGLGCFCFGMGGPRRARYIDPGLTPPGSLGSRLRRPQSHKMTDMSCSVNGN